jgi:tripartite-type tricarboxylate transporter receptor subunit TctC
MRRAGTGSRLRLKFGLGLKLGLGLLLSTIASAMPFSALAQAPYPTRPITLVVPFAAGGPNDVMARIVSEHMSRTLGQPIIVENSAGAGGTTGSARVAQAAPDGYTFLSGHVGTHAAAPALYPNLRYNPLTDFTPIGQVAETPIVIATKRDFPAADLATFVAAAKARGQSLMLGHAGVGSIGHISCLLLTSAVGFKPVEVPYRGSAPAMTDLIAGHYDFACALLADALPFIAGDRLRFLAVSAPARVPQLPQTPTATEAGLPQFKASSWFAFYLPKGAPEPVRDRLAGALDAALNDAGVKQKLETAGLILPAAGERGPAALTRRMTEEIARWSAIVKAAQIRLE